MYTDYFTDICCRIFRMDDMTYNAHYESMRKAPGRRLSKNKRLIMKHKDLQKHCDKVIQKHRVDTRYFTTEIKREQLMVEKKIEKLKKQQEKYSMTSEKTHFFLDTAERGHLNREKTFNHEKVESRSKEVRDLEAELIKAINKLHMPKVMKERLAMETFRLNSLKS